ncbi:MAG TPA: DNA primase [Microbacteriaceae bacterium]|nr:DNA primase [Microbacteriaceae bacterium]
MPGLIRRSDIDEVRARTNIADIIGDYVTLKSAGVGSLKGLCPFHDERSPSFNVRPAVGYFHCFGCGEGGNVYDFLMKIDHVTFPEAVERLAQRAGYELHYEDSGSGQREQERGNRTRILAANAAAEQFFQQQLRAPEAEPGRRFLGERGFDQEAAQRFGVGFAPRSGALGKALRAQGFTDEELVQAGLLGKGERGDVYDRFRSRLIWPIRDTTGQTVGFGARKLLDEDQGPKYLNTPETPVYHKAQVLYGLDLAKRDIARQKQVVVVEGYTDVMAAHLAGVTTAVATCGTAFGVDHIKIIRRILGDSDQNAVASAGEVVFTFDGDEAGLKAASRAFEEESRFNAQTFVAVAPDGLDPCDLRLQRGDGAVRALIESRKPLFEFIIRRTFAGFDLESAEGRVQALRAAAPVVAGIRDQALVTEYARLLARWLGIDPSETLAAVRVARRQGGPSTRSARSGSDRAGPDSRSPSDGPDSRSLSEGPHYRSLSEGGARVEGSPPITLASLGRDPNTRLEVEVLQALLQYPAEVGPELSGRVVAAAFADPSLAVVRDAIAVQLRSAGDAGWVDEVTIEAPEPYRGLVRELAVSPIPGRPETLPQTVRAVAASLVDRELLRRKRDALGALQRIEREAEPERFGELQRELVAIDAERTRLRGD